MRRVLIAALLVVSIGDLGSAQARRTYSPPVRSGGVRGGVARPPGVPSRPRPTAPARPSGGGAAGSPSGRSGQPGYSGPSNRATPRRTNPTPGAPANANRPRSGGVAAGGNSGGNRVVVPLAIPPKSSAEVASAKASSQAALAQLRAKRGDRLARAGGGGANNGNGGGNGNGGAGGESPRRVAANDNLSIGTRTKQRLLAGVVDPELRKTIERLYGDTATEGDGGTAAALRLENRTGKPLRSRTGHAQKAGEMRTRLANHLRSGRLTPQEVELVKQLDADLADALKEAQNK